VTFLDLVGPGYLFGALARRSQWTICANSLVRRSTPWEAVACPVAPAGEGCDSRRLAEESPREKEATMTTHGVSRSLGAAAAVLLALSITTGARAAEPKRGGVLKVAERADPVGFDTLGKKKAPVYTQLALAYTHNRLFKYAPGGEIVPDLAASYTQPNPTTYVVTLRKGVKWHARPPVNGRELTSEDVKFTFERLAASPEERLFPTLKRLTTPDRYTVKFELGAPTPSFIANLAATTMYIYAKEAGKAAPDGGRDYTSVDTVVGTGPFTLEEYREKQRMVFKRNPNYFEAGKPYLDGVELYTIADPAAQLAALRTGKIDLIPASTGQGLPHFLAGEARSMPGATVVSHHIFQTGEHVVGRLDTKPWSDVRVRRAVALAIDRQGFMKAMYPEGAELVGGPIPPTSHYAIKIEALGEAGRWYRYDVAAARKLLAEAGYPNGVKTRLVTTSGYGPEYLSRTELLKDMLARIGIEASIVVQEYPVWIAKTYKGDYEGLVHLPNWTLGEEDEWLATYTPGDTRNHIHMDDPKTTELVKAIREAPNDQTRAKLIGQFLRTFHDQQYRVFLPMPTLLTVVGPHAKGYVPTIRGYTYPVALVNTWME
jgi:peptide/nickel transport system substrate-binding protein